MEFINRRTPPGVRELKLPIDHHKLSYPSRTPPGVRELKPVYKSP